jgi:hypothetical protein
MGVAPTRHDVGLDRAVTNGRFDLHDARRWPLPCKSAIRWCHSGLIEGMGGGPALADYCRSIFSKRNPIAHEGADASRDLAEEVLIKSREVVEYLRRKGVEPMVPD